VSCHEAVNVRVDQHLLVEAVDAVVQGGSVAPDLDPRGGVQRAVKSEGVAHLGGYRSFTDALFHASTVYLWAGWITQQ
jgi:hypothetical protein